MYPCSGKCFKALGITDSSGAKLSSSSIKFLIQCADKDANGKMSYDEFQSMVTVQVWFRDFKSLKNSIVVDAFLQSQIVQIIFDTKIKIKVTMTDLFKLSE